jgi:type III restriction enzyme
MLVLETKGQDTEQDRTKRRFLDEWVNAVNAHGGFGRWRWDISRAPGDIKDILLRHAGEPQADLSQQEFVDWREPA